MSGHQDRGRHEETASNKSRPHHCIPRKIRPPRALGHLCAAQSCGKRDILPHCIDRSPTYSLQGWGIYCARVKVLLTLVGLNLSEVYGVRPCRCGPNGVDTISVNEHTDYVVVTSGRRR